MAAMTVARLAPDHGWCSEWSRNKRPTSLFVLLFVLLAVLLVLLLAAGRPALRRRQKLSLFSPPKFPACPSPASLTHPSLRLSLATLFIPFIPFTLVIH
jgi:hypothetical protein